MRPVAWANKLGLNRSNTSSEESPHNGRSGSGSNRSDTRSEPFRQRRSNSPDFSLRSSK
jgi:hypothetical protein